MKQQLIKKTVTSLMVLATMLYASTSNAHFYRFGFMVNQTTQVLTLTCPAGTAQVRAAVLDGTENAGLMSVTIFKGGSAQVVSDPSQGDGTFGPVATVAGGDNGPYYLIASQTSPVLSQYQLLYHCDDANGVELPAAPSLVVTQF